jgi:predicted NBD/HSP70 family sugar kinase
MAPEAMIDSTGGSMGSRSLLRRMNSLGILRAVLQAPSTLRTLANDSGLSRTAVDAIVTDLVGLGWLEPAEATATSRIGRPAAAFRVRTGLGHLLSIDIGANHIQVVVAELSGAVLGQRTAHLDEDTEAAERLATALATGDAALADLDLDRSSVWVTTIGSPGAIGRNGEVLHFGGTGLPGWVGLDLQDWFGREFDGAVLVEGDVALGAHAELALGAARGRRDVVYLLCGVRTSGSSIIDGRVHRGVHGAAGIVGEMPELRWSRLNEEYGGSVLGTPRPSREQIFDAARAGDRIAGIAVAEFADDLATGAAALTLAVDPELLVIGGGSAPGADVFLPRFIETLGAICPLPPEVVVSALGSEAVALGGISLASQRLDRVLEAAVRQRERFPGPEESRRLARQAPVS